MIGLLFMAGIATSIVGQAGAHGAGTTVTTSGAVTTIAGGTRAGANLFHSFSDFSLGTGDTARWTASDASAIRNVVNRVTGGRTSTIDGTIDSTALPNAAFFFINPAGIVFGAHAVVNVPAAAYFSTASRIGFADGRAFLATTDTGSRFSIAEPSGFGFLGSEAALSVRGAGAKFAGSTPALSLSATRIAVRDADLRTGAFDLIATGTAPIDLSLADPLAAGATGRLTIADTSIAGTPGSTFRLGGDVTLSNASLIANTENGRRGGGIRVRGPSLDLADLSMLSTAGAGATGGDIAIDVDALTIAGGSGLFTSATAQTGNAGDIAIRTRDLTLGMDGDDGASGFSQIASSSFGAGHAGRITILSTRLMRIGPSGRIVADSFSSGAGGDIAIDAGRLTMDGGLISSEAIDLGDAGAIRVSADSLLVGGSASITSSAFSDGDAGSLTIKADALTVDGSFLTSDSSGAGRAGDIAITAGKARFIGGTVVGSDGFDAGDAGGVSLTADHLVIGDSTISSSAHLNGRGGDIRVKAGDFLLSVSEIASQSEGDGDAGDIAITADTLKLDNGFVSSSTGGSGAAGDIDIVARETGLDFFSEVSSDSFAAGNAGRIRIGGGSLTLDQGSTISTDALDIGRGGDIEIALDRGLSLANTGAISADAAGCADCDRGGDAGSIRISAASLSLDGSAFITSSTQSSGNAGSIRLDIGAIALDSGLIESIARLGSLGDAGSVEVTAHSLDLSDGASISTSTRGDGSAGRVRIAADTLHMNGGSITSEATETSDGDAGEVRVAAGAISILANARISSGTLSTGKAGDVSVAADTLTLAGGGTIATSTAAAGNAGSVAVTVTQALSIASGGAIRSNALEGSTGRSGAVTVTASDARLSGGVIETGSANRKAAGRIALTAQTLEIVGADSHISSANTSARPGAAGTVQIAATGIMLGDGGAISTNSVAGPAGDIMLDMPTNGILTLQGDALPGTITTSSGPGTGGVIRIAAPRAILSNGGSILAKGAARGADVAISSLFFIRSADRPNLIEVDGLLVLDNTVEDVTNGTVPQDLSFLDASRVLHDQCAATRQIGEVSLLTTPAAGPYAAEPRRDYRLFMPGGSDLPAHKAGGCS